jgi:membrane protein implicated in regulation of membrane protease activity
MKWIRDNSLTLVLLAFFLLSLTGQALSGVAAENQERQQDGAAALSLADYLGTGAFLSALFENWESEFLQMWVYVMLTAYLFQRGSPESRDPDEKQGRPGDAAGRLGTLGKKLYAHSLGLALLGLFVLSFLLHWWTSTRHAAEQAARNGEPLPGLAGHLSDPQLWFESFQNWQSEFLSTAVLVVLGIFLRERWSPESKAVEDPHEKTGAD